MMQRAPWSATLDACAPYDGSPGYRLSDIASSRFFRHSVGLLMEGVITGLDRAAFLQAARALGHAEPSPRASIDPDGWDLGV